MAMADAAVPDVDKGTWVQVWAQVVKQEKVHPEDFILRFESHNEDFKAHIKRTHVIVPTEQPSWVPKCTAMTRDAELDSDAFFRCKRNHDHDGDHKNGALTWDSRAIAGYSEEN